MKQVASLKLFGGDGLVAKCGVPRPRSICGVPSGGADYQSNLDEGIESSFDVGSRTRTQFFFDNRNRLQNVLITYFDELGNPLPKLEFQLFPRPILQRLVDAIYRWL